MKSFEEAINSLKQAEFAEVNDETLSDFYIEIKKLYEQCLDEILYRVLKSRWKENGKD